MTPLRRMRWAAHIERLVSWEMNAISQEIFKKDTSWEVYTEIRMKIGIKMELLGSCMLGLSKIIRV
jgi:hypothetical protein